MLCCYKTHGKSLTFGQIQKHRFWIVGDSYRLSFHFYPVLLKRTTSFKNELLPCIPSWDQIRSNEPTNINKLKKLWIKNCQSKDINGDEQQKILIIKKLRPANVWHQCQNELINYENKCQLILFPASYSSGGAGISPPTLWAAELKMLPSTNITNITAANNEEWPLNTHNVV